MRSLRRINGLVSTTSNGLDFCSGRQRPLFSALAGSVASNGAVLRVACIFWTDVIEAEWVLALERNRQDLRTLIARTTHLMRERLPEAYVPYDDLAPLR